MLKVIIYPFSIFMLSCVLSFAQPNNISYSRIPLGFYPNMYENKVHGSLDSFKIILNTILSSKSMKELREKENNNNNGIWFSLMEMRNIDWKNNKSDVINFLDSLIESSIHNNIYLKEKYSEKDKFPVCDPVLFPLIMHWVMLNIDFEFTSKQIFKRFFKDKDSFFDKEAYRSLILFCLKDSYKQKKVDIFLKDITSNKSFYLNSYDSTIISKILHDNEIAKIGNQEKTWNFFIKDTKLDFSDIASPKNEIIMYNNLLIFTDVYPNSDLLGLLRKIKKTENYKEKYILLYGLCGLLNDNLTKNPPKNIDKNTIIKIKTEVEHFFAEYGSLKEFNNYNFMLYTYKATQRLTEKF